MGLSETIIAAIIGASATVSAAGFQLMRTRVQPSARPRRSMLRTILMLVALVAASAVGGYAYSELRADGARQEIDRLRGEISGQLQALAVANSRRAELLASRPPEVASEALVQLAPCVRSAEDSDGPAPICEARSVVPVLLCTQIPATAKRLGIERYSRPPGGNGEWEVHTDESGAGSHDVSFTDVAAGDAGTAGLVPVCVAVRNEDPSSARVARLVVRYLPAQPGQPPAVAAR